MSSSSTGTTSSRTAAKPCSPAKHTKRLVSAVRKAIRKSPKNTKNPRITKIVSPPDHATASRSTDTRTESVGSSTTGGSDYASAAGSPGIISGVESPTRTRRSSEGDLTATSTPEIRPRTKLTNLKPRSESSLLRIRAQLRAAAEVSMEQSVRQVDEPKEEEREAESSFVSDISAVGGGALHEMPRLANALLQKTKTRLEESRNMNREIREDVCSGLHGLHEMILRLSDSRNRHIADKEKMRASYERRLTQTEAKYAAALRSLSETAQTTQKEILDAIKAAHREAETSRYLFLDIEQGFKENLSLTRTEKATPQNEPLQAIQTDIALLRLDVGTLNETVKDSLDRIQARQQSRQEEPVACEARKTYAGADSSHKQSARADGMQSSFPLMIESADPRDTCDDVVKSIKNSVNVIELGVGVNSVRKRRNQKVVIACDTADDRSKLQEAIKTSSQKLTVTQMKAKNPLLRLSGVINDISDRHVEEAILKQNSSILIGVPLEDRQIKVVRRTKGRTKEVGNVILEVAPRLHHLIRDSKLRVGYQVVYAADQSPLVQCYQCLGFGHFFRECRNEVSCGHCAEGHDTRQCPRKDSTPKCINCSKAGSIASASSHAAYSRACPIWQKWDRVARSSVSYC
ncbi:uncharacterized protein LOC120634525 [Pararge aegeria]|uniref:uncharacterized protein LOC120634525 n=1 Tax=Pararge aegeria TaxID=116150 RepID=UPI0019D14838|nr:uncharacterized protein LOC120634525 [Pararge aegeria]